MKALEKIGCLTFVSAAMHPCRVDGKSCQSGIHRSQTLGHRVIFLQLKQKREVVNIAILPDYLIAADYHQPII